MGIRKEYKKYFGRQIKDECVHNAEDVIEFAKHYQALSQHDDKSSTTTTTTCIVKANKQQLEDVGCDEDLMDCEVVYIKDYPTGYSQIKFERKDMSQILGKPIFLHYDIPKKWLEFK
jgi:hypothetical protein